MAMTATVLQDLRANYPSLLDRHELRGEIYTLLSKGVTNTNNPSVGIISSDVMDKAMMSWGRNVDIPVMSPATGATGTGLSCTCTGTEAVSDLVNITWVSVSYCFEMQPAKNFQNEIKYAQEFARKYTDGIRAMALSIDQAVDTSLTAALAPEAQYGSTYIGAGNKYGALVGNAIQVSLANRNDFFNDLVDIMAEDDLFPMFDVCASVNARGIISQLFAQGEANANNTQYQFTQGDYQFGFGKNVTVGAASDASGYIMPAGAYGIVHRNSPDCLAGTLTTKGHQYGTLFDPTLGMTMDTLFYSDCADINAITGNADDTAAVNEVHQMAVHYGILTPYANFANSGNSQVIRKFDLLNS